MLQFRQEVTPRCLHLVADTLHGGVRQGVECKCIEALCLPRSSGQSRHAARERIAIPPARLPDARGRVPNARQATGCRWSRASRTVAARLSAVKGFARKGVLSFGLG